MAKKVKSKQKQKQKQRQSQSVKVVVNLAKPKTKRRRRAAPREPAMMAPQQIALPPVVYQMPPPLTFYGQPEPAREQSLVNVTAGRTIGEMPANRIPVMEEQKQPDITETSIPMNIMESVKAVQPAKDLRAKRDADKASYAEKQAQKAAARAERQYEIMKNVEAEAAASRESGSALNTKGARAKKSTTSTEQLWTNINNNNNIDDTDGV